MPSAARPRPGQCGEARSEAHGDQPEADRQRQVGDPGRHAFGDGAAGRAVDVESAMLPSARSVAIIEPMAPATMCAAVPTGPFGRNSPVASVSSLPSRAAIAAPSMPSQSVRFDANAADP